MHRVSPARRGPPLVEAALLITVVFGLALAAAIIGGPAASLPLVQLLAIGAPVLVYAIVHPVDAVSLLGLERPHPAAIGGALLAGAGVLAVNISAIVPLSFVVWGEPVKAPPIILSGSIAWQLVAVAVIPALCEELVFRGVLFRSLLRRSAWVAVLGSAAVFALFHMSPHRLLPTFAVGAVAGVCLLRSRSTWAAIACHLANNAALIILVPAAGWLESVPTTVIGVSGFLLVGSGLWMTGIRAVQ